MNSQRPQLMAIFLTCLLGIALSITDHHHSAAQSGVDGTEEAPDLRLVQEKSFIWMTGYVQSLTAEVLAQASARRHLHELVSVEIFPTWREDVGPKGGHFGESPTWRHDKNAAEEKKEQLSKELIEKLEQLDKALRDALETASWSKCTDLMNLLSWDNTAVRALARLRYSLTDPNSDTDYSRGLFEGEVHLFWLWPPNEGKDVPGKRVRVGLFSVGDAARVLVFTEKHSQQLLSVLGELAASD